MHGLTGPLGQEGQIGFGDLLEIQFSDQRVINLESYKKDGKSVQTPVWMVVDGETVYVRTDPNTWKVKRIRHNPLVRIAPSNMRGDVLGPWTKGEAHYAEGQEKDRILALFKKKYGLMARMSDSFNRVRGRNVSTVIAIKVLPG